MSTPQVEIRSRPSMALFAILAIVMVIGSYIFVLLLAGACVYLPYLLLSASDSPGAQVVLLFLFGIVIAGAMLWSLVPRRDKFVPPGMLLDRSSQPGLFAELDSIAAALNETLPREVYLIPDANAFVADRGGMMGFGSRRVMGLGLPLLSILTVSQFRAVLAHEFAHYYGGDTSLGPWVYKTKTSIIRIFENIGSVGELARIAILGIMYLAVATLLKWYFIGFLRAINLVSRRQEFRADELACLVAGRQNLVDGLQAIHGIALTWPAYWKNEVAPPLSGGRLVAIGEGFARFISNPQVSAAIGETLGKRLQEEKTNPYDTHPPLRERIAAVQGFGNHPALQDSRPATALLENLSTAEIRFAEACVPDVRPGSLKYVRWDEVASLITIPDWNQFVSEYPQPLQGVIAECLPDQIPKLLAIGSTIRDPKGMLLSPNQRAGRAGYLFAAAFALALTRSGWELQVQPGISRIRRGDQELNPFGIMDQLIKGKLSRDAWVAQCQQLGIGQLALAPGEFKPIDSARGSGSI